MANKLSHSAVSKYQTCGMAYKYHYIDKIRPKVHSAALVFGNAIDNALNEMLLRTDKSPEDVFINSFTHTTINDESVYVPTYTELVYKAGDWDFDLLTEDDFDSVKKAVEDGAIQEYDDYLEVYTNLRKRKTEKGFDSLDTDEKRFFNLMNWLCSKRRGLLMLKAYRKKVMPKIIKVHTVQKKVTLKNQDGDEITGYIDLVAEVKGHGNVILDNKTSSKEYVDGVILTSPQLSLYMHILGEEYKTRKAGYIVMLKTVMKNRKKVCSVCGNDGSGGRHKTCDAKIEGKRCDGEWNETIDPDVHIQFMVDEIPQQTEDIVIENFDNTNEAIKSGVYTRNFNSCHNHFGSLCPYFQKCWRGKDTGLVNMKKEYK